MPIYIALFFYLTTKIIVAIVSDKLYAYHSTNKIKEIDSQYSDTVIQRQNIKQAGGTNIILPTLLTLPLLIIALLITLATVFLFNAFDKQTSPEIIQTTNVTTNSRTIKNPTRFKVNLKDITTNLADKGTIVVIGLTFELENQKAMIEFQELDVKVKSIINQTLADLTVEQVSGAAGQDALTSMLMNKINVIMKEGKVTEINIPKIITQ